MYRKSIYTLVAVIVLLSMVLSACAQPATPPPPAETQAPVATEAPTEPPAATEAPTEPPAATEAPTAAPAATEAPTQPPAAAFTPMKMEAPDCNYGGNMKSMESVDANTVKFTFCAPDVAFLGKVAVPSFGIMSAKQLQETGGDAAKINDNPIGTGPYIMKEWVRGDHITFEPNPNYWGTPAKNKQFILKWNKEAASRLLDLQSGNTNGISEITVDDIKTVEADANLALAPINVNNFLYLGVQNETPPFDNEKVRQGFAMAIDKQRIVDNFYAPGSVAATQFVPPGVKPGFTDGYKGNTYDPEKAKALLKEANFDFNKEYVLSYAERTRPYFPFPTKIAQDLQAQFTELGIKMKLEMEEWATYLPATRDGKKALFLLGWSEDYPDATNWYDVFLLGSSKSFGKPFPDMVELIKKAAATGDATARQADYDQVNKLYDQHVPCIVLAHGTIVQAFQKAVKNVVVGPYNENFPEMETDSGTLVYEQDGEPVSLYANDETDGNSFRATRNALYDTLYDFKFGTTETKPALAEKCVPNTDATEWTCTLRKDVKFSDGTAFTANDVVTTFGIMWDAKNPLRKGNTGAFQYWKDFFGPKTLNAPPE